MGYTSEGSGDSRYGDAVVAGKGEIDMRYTTGAAHSGTGLARTNFAARMLLAVLALLLHPAFGAGPAGALQRNPALASLQIEI